MFLYVAERERLLAAQNFNELEAFAKIFRVSKRLVLFDLLFNFNHEGKKTEIVIGLVPSIDYIYKVPSINKKGCRVCV